MAYGVLLACVLCGSTSGVFYYSPILLRQLSHCNWNLLAIKPPGVLPTLSPSTKVKDAQHMGAGIPIRVLVLAWQPCAHRALSQALSLAVHTLVPG